MSHKAQGSLSQASLFAMVLGSIIGWGSFMLPGEKFLREGGVINTALGLIFGMISVIFIEKNYETMMAFQSEEGGEFTFAYTNLGNVHGFVVGWFLTLAYFTIIPLDAVAFPLVIDKMLGGVLKVGYLYDIAGKPVYLGEVLAADFVIALFSYLNIKGIKTSSKVQNIMVGALVSVVVLVSLAMAFKGNRPQFSRSYIDDYRFDIGAAARVFAITPFAFLGFDTIPQLCKEFRFSSKKAGAIAVLSLVIGTAMYNLLNVITALAYTPEQAILQDWAAGGAVLQTLGKGAFLALIVALTAALWTGINGFILASSKLFGSVAQAGMLPASIGKMSEKRVYKNAILFLAAVSMAAPWFSRQVVLWIVDMSSLGAAIAYFYVCLIAGKKDRSVLSLAYSFLGMAVSFLICLLLLIPGSPAALGKESLIALGAWCALGALFYTALRQKVK